MRITEIPIQILEIESEGYHMMVQGFINGKQASFLVDTGASRTVFDMEAIKIYLPEPSFEENEKLSTGLGTNSMPSHVTIINSIKFGELEINAYLAIVIDLQHVHQSYSMLGLPEINGVLGGDILNSYKAVINYKKKKLKLYF
jgi:predicted aspartyl protease